MSLTKYRISYMDERTDDVVVVGEGDYIRAQRATNTTLGTASRLGDSEFFTRVAYSGAKRAGITTLDFDAWADLIARVAIEEEPGESQTPSGE